MKKILFIFLIALSLTSFQTDTLIEENTTDKVVLVGVSRYEHFSSWRFTDDDAYRLNAFHSSHHVPDENITVLIDEDAENKDIIEEVTNVASNCTDNDNFFFYFDGHSIPTGILGYDGMVDNIVTYERLEKILKNSDAKHKLLIINAPYSENTEKTFDENTTVFFAGSEDETTPETDGLRQTIFGHFLIRGLKGAANINDDKIVTEIIMYVKEIIMCVRNSI